MGNDMNTDDEKKGVKVSIDNPDYPKVADLSDGDIGEPIYIKPAFTDTKVTKNEVTGTVEIDDPEFESIAEEMPLGLSTTAVTPSTSYTVSKDIVFKFFQKHGIDTNEIAGIIGDLVGKSLIIVDDDTDLPGSVIPEEKKPEKRLSIDCNLGEIYYLEDKGCYALIVGFFHNDNSGDDWVATRTTRMKNPAMLDSWMGLDQDPPANEAIIVNCSCGVLQFGARYIYNMKPDNIGKYLSGKPLYTLTKEQFDAVIEFLETYESKNAGEC